MYIVKIPFIFRNKRYKAGEQIELSKEDYERLAWYGYVEEKKDKPNLEQMSFNELKKLAKKLKLEVSNKTTKKEIIGMLNEKVEL